MLLIFGSVNLDHSSYVETLPRPGETIIGHDLAISPGGKGANQAFNAAKFGANTLLVACMGKDLQAENAVSQLKEVGVDLSMCKWLDDQPTGFAAIAIDKMGENSIIVIPGANLHLRAEMLDDDRLKSARYLVTQMEVSLQETITAIKKASQLGVKTIHSLAPFAPVPTELFDHIDYLLLNETEASDLIYRLSSDDDRLNEPSAIARRFSMSLIITQGADGVLYLSPQGEEIVYPAHAIKPIDTTGAGDCFAGAFASMLDQGLSVDGAIKNAIKAAGLHCLEKGAQPNSPKQSDL